MKIQAIQTGVLNILDSLGFLYIPSKHTFPVPSANKGRKQHRSTLPENVQINKHTKELETVRTNEQNLLPAQIDSEWTKESVLSLSIHSDRSEDLTEEEIQLIELNNSQGKETLIIAKAVTIKRLWARGLKNEEISMILGSGFGISTVCKYTPLFNRGRG